MDRQEMNADIAVVGFGPAAAGFLLTLAPELAKTKEDGAPLLESKSMPGCPLQIMCYERADDPGFGVSGIVTRADAIKASFPDLDLASEIPGAAPVGKERMLYLFDHLGCSRRTLSTKIVDAAFKIGGIFMKKEPAARTLPFIPPFMDKKGGFVATMGSFMGWCAMRAMNEGIMVMPGSPVEGPLFEGDRVVGIRMVDQGVEKDGTPGPAYMPGMDIKASLVVAADGPVGAVGRALDERFGLPEGHRRHEWAVGMKALVELPEGTQLEPGTVIHTMGFPEPEIFGFMYVLADRKASLGVFIAPWMDSPVRTSYRYFQHWMQHPAIWKHLKGGKLLSWGAKSLQESGVEGEPFLAGNGWARIGEGACTTDALTTSGVDEAWAAGVMLAKAVLELAKAGKDFTKENLEATYVAARRASPQARALEKARHARAGFSKNFLLGMFGMGICGLTGGRLHLGRFCRSVHPADRVPTLEKAIFHRVRDEKALAEAIKAADRAGNTRHDAVMDAIGWPRIELDGELMMSHQDALFKGGKVQAASGFADHVSFADPALCAKCEKRVCVEMCSAQALTPPETPGLPPRFDREKCIHCGACIWNCSARLPGSERTNVVFKAGSGGLHSNEN